MGTEDEYAEKLFKANLIVQLDGNAEPWPVLVSHRKQCEKKKEESLVYLSKTSLLAA